MDRFIPFCVIFNGNCALLPATLSCKWVQFLFLWMQNYIAIFKSLLISFFRRKIFGLVLKQRIYMGNNWEKHQKCAFVFVQNFNYLFSIIASVMSATVMTFIGCDKFDSRLDPDIPQTIKKHIWMLLSQDFFAFKKTQGGVF